MNTNLPLPIAVIMISRNESHNIIHIIENLRGFATEIFLVDSYSTDNTVELALNKGVRVFQRPFKDFGDQWNFAVSTLPVTQPWTMKLDPDERITDELKLQISTEIEADAFDAISFPRKLWFMGQELPVKQFVLRLWRTGICTFTNSKVNEHPIISGEEKQLTGVLEHHDSPNLHHWYEKQNRYSTAEACIAYTGIGHTAEPSFFGTSLERKSWLKAVYGHLPFRHILMNIYCLTFLGAWRGGKAGFIWSRMRADVYRMRELKRLEMEWQKKSYDVPSNPTMEERVNNNRKQDYVEVRIDCDGKITAIS